jgi:RNA recognition motif-containing protein
MRIYVGNLAAQTTENELRETFAAYGQVSQVAIITDKKTGLPRGFGFVEMDQTEEGEQAISELHGTLLGDRTLKVKPARSREEGNGEDRSRADQR